MPEWPIDLPCRGILGQIGLAPQDNRVFFKTDIGPPITAPRGTAVGDKIQQGIAINQAQWATFREWYANDVAGGSKAFTMRDPTTRAVVWMQFDESPYQISERASGKYVLSLNLIRLS